MDNKTEKIEIDFSEKAIASKLALIKLQQEDITELHTDLLAQRFIDYRDRIRASLDFTHKF